MPRDRGQGPGELSREERSWILTHLRHLSDMPSEDEEPFCCYQLAEPLKSKFNALVAYNMIEKAEPVDCSNIEPSENAPKSESTIWSWRFHEATREVIEDYLEKRDERNEDNPLPCKCPVIAFKNDGDSVRCHECGGEWWREDGEFIPIDPPEATPRVECPHGVPGCPGPGVAPDDPIIRENRLAPVTHHCARCGNAATEQGAEGSP